MSNNCYDEIARNAQPNTITCYETSPGLIATCKTFEGADYHICYGIDTTGNIYDICVLTSNSASFETGQCNIETIFETQEILAEILKPQAVDHAAVQK